MRTHGTLSKWNEERGFGFITPAGGSGVLFVHVSAFPKDGIRPRLNELISFEVETGSEGKSRAVRVMRPGSRTTARRGHQKKPSAPARAIGTALLGVLAIGAIGFHGYSTFASRPAAPAPMDSPSRAAASIPAQAFACDGRTRCSQMTSCAEATYFLRHCPGTQMDGNGDGEPCEQQWCN